MIKKTINAFAFIEILEKNKIMENSSNRLIYIDLIKVFLTCMVVIHHAGQAYGNTGGVWLVSEAEKLAYLRPFFFFNAAYMMGFYFFISGYFIYFSLKRKSKTKFLAERFIKLGIPLVFFIFFIFTPLHYFLSNSQSNYFNFAFDLHFNRPPLSVGHLWFVASLLVYSIIYLFLSQIKIGTSKQAMQFNAWYPLVYLAVLIPINVLVRQLYPIDKWVTWGIPLEVAHFPQYFSLFLLGTLFNQNKWLESIKISTGLMYLGFALLLFLSQSFISDSLPKLWSESFIESFLCVGLCLGLIVIFKKGFNTMNPITKILSENSYGIYLFHLLIVIGLQLIFIKFNLNSNLKFVLVSLLGIIISCAMSYGLRKNSIIRKVI
jgi:fucose 4-O-acetylase-like acetyltransferase